MDGAERHLLVLRSHLMLVMQLYILISSSATLRDAILERWLFKYSDQLEKIAGKDGETESILQEWFFSFISA